MTDYLTVVFRQPIGPAARTLLESGEWTAASHSHAIHDRDEAKQEAEKLRAEIERLRAEIERLRAELEAISAANSKILEENKELSVAVIESRLELVALRNQEPVARCATDESGEKVEALSFNKSRRRFDTPLYFAAGAQPATQITPNWIWAWLMDWCRRRGVPPSNYDSLFQMASDALLLASGAQPAPNPEVYDWPEGATHYQPQQKAFYKRVSACEWYVWSRITDEPLHWLYSPGTMDSAEWIVRAQPAPIPADAAQDLLAACKEFVRKVEAGEARSVRSYEQMKADIAKAESAQPAPSAPEVTAMVDAAMEATQHIHPPITRSQCKLIIEAARAAAPETPKPASR